MFSPSPAPAPLQYPNLPQHLAQQYATIPFIQPVQQRGRPPVVVCEFYILIIFV